jgi:hypothetical protein
MRHPYLAKMYSAQDELAKDFTQKIEEEGRIVESKEEREKVYYESEDEDQTLMWEFDQRELQEMDLRKLFWVELEKFQRRRVRYRERNYPQKSKEK